MKKRFHLNLSYPQILIFGFLIVILLGTLLLMLPFSTKSGEVTPFIDALLTATSATCVTGLAVRDTFSYWSFFGQAVILVLIQTGGLGFMTVITAFSVFRKKEISLRERILLMQSAGSMRLSGVKTLMRKVVVATAVFEFSGFILLSLRYCKRIGFPRGLWSALFHSVSAFCNAGFDLNGQFGESSFAGYVDDPLVNLTLILLIISGGLGFFVWSDLIKKRFRLKNCELHTKVVLTVTAILVLTAAVTFYFTESGAAFKNLKGPEKWLAAFFQSVTTRTAGFFSVDQTTLSNSGTIVSILLMMIGGSPCSTAGGMKTTTFAVIIMSILSCARNSKQPIIFKRRLDDNIVRQASAIAGIYVLLLIASCTLLCSFEKFGISEIVFEAASALSTTGLSMNLTPLLCPASEAVLVFLMFTGRIGGLSVALAFAEKRFDPPLQRPLGKILIG